MTVRKQTSIVFSFLKLKQTETVRNKFAVGVSSRQQVHYACSVLCAMRWLRLLRAQPVLSFSLALRVSHIVLIDCLR